MGTLFCLGQQLGFVEPEHFLAGQADLGHGDAGILREEEVVDLGIANADAVSHFVPVIVGIDGVAGLGRLAVIQLAVTAGQVEAGSVVGQMALTHPVDGLVVHLHGDVHIDIQLVSAIHNVLGHLLPLPAVPVGDVADLGVAFHRRHLAVGLQLPGLAAMGAGDGGTLAQHPGLGAAVGALIQDAVQAVGTEGLIDLDALVLLPLEVVETECSIDAVGQLLDSHGLDLLLGKEDIGPGGHLLVLADLKLIIKRVPGEGAEGLHHDDGNAELLQQDAESPGQGSCGAVEGIAGFGIHQHTGLQGLEAVFHILDQTQVGNILLGGDAADGTHDPLHQAAEADEAIVGGHDVEDPGEEHFMGDLHVQEAGVVHQDQAGLVLVDAVELDLIFEAGAHQAEEAQELDQQTPEQIDPAGGLVLRTGQGHDGLIIHIFDGGFHFCTLLIADWGVVIAVFHYSIRS